MSVLDGAALAVIFLTIIQIATAIVLLGSLPGKIALKRGHPYPAAVNAASWIGLATGIFWPVAFIWAFLPYPASRDGVSAVGGTEAELAEMRERLATLETAAAKAASGTAGASA